MLFGDITHSPDLPSIVKSRPINDKNHNSILMKLNKVRHFTYTNDSNKFDDKINKLIGKMQRDGFTIVPTKMYFKKGKAKIELAIAKGKKQFDKRATKKNRDWSRDKARYVRKSS